MKTSKKCQYALNAIFELAVRNSNRAIRVHDIATAQKIPSRFLEIILNELRHGGLVESKRGSEGGYRLARAAEKISVSEVIECIEGPISNNPSTGPMKESRTFFADWAFGELWQKIDTAVEQICDNTTFAELVKDATDKKNAQAPSYNI